MRSCTSSTVRPAPTSPSHVLQSDSRVTAPDGEVIPSSTPRQRPQTTTSFIQSQPPAPQGSQGLHDLWTFVLRAQNAVAQDVTHHQLLHQASQDLAHSEARLRRSKGQLETIESAIENFKRTFEANGLSEVVDFSVGWTVYPIPVSVPPPPTM